MSPTIDQRYTRREARGAIEQLNDDGIKLGGIWWNNSRRQPVDLDGYRVGDVVRLVASQTADGQRRFLLEIEPAGSQRSAPAVAGPEQPRASAASRGGVEWVDDMPDDVADDAHPDT